MILDKKEKFLTLSVFEPESYSPKPSRHNKHTSAHWHIRTVTWTERGAIKEWAGSKQRSSCACLYAVGLCYWTTKLTSNFCICRALLEAPAVSPKPQATPVFPVITTIVICCLFCRFHFLEGTGTRTDWLPAYLGESDSANCASYTAEHRMQKFQLAPQSSSNFSFPQLISVSNKVTHLILTLSRI